MIQVYREKNDLSFLTKVKDLTVFLYQILMVKFALGVPYNSVTPASVVRIIWIVSKSMALVLFETWSTSSKWKI